MMVGKSITERWSEDTNPFGFTSNTQEICKYNHEHDPDNTLGKSSITKRYREFETNNSFTIAKTEPEKMLVFGWSNVAIRKDGTQVHDLQDDVIDAEELEKAAYDHVLNFRNTGEKHDPQLRKKGRLVESCVFTKEKQAALGIPPGVVPVGWWVGYKIDDPDAWDKIKKGEYAMFSVEGTGKRERIAKSYDELRKFNPYHGRDGRFSNRGGYAMFSPGSDPKQAARSIANENARRVAEGGQGDVGGAHWNMSVVPGIDPVTGKNMVRQKTSYDRAKHMAELNQKHMTDQKAAEEAAKKQQVTTPDKAGKSIKWANMMNDEFVASLDKTMPGLDRVEKGYAKGKDRTQFMDTKQNGDMVLTDIYTERGFHGKPTMMDKADIKQYIAQHGTPELYRGMGMSSSGQSGAEKQTRFAQDDKHFAGLGVLGNGTYAAQTPTGSAYNTGLRTARSYSNGSSDGSVRMTLAKGSHVASYQTVRRQQQEFSANVRSAKWNGKLSQDRANKILDIVSDEGRFAALRGYDAYYDKTTANSGASKNTPYWVILNRGKIIIQNERYT